MRFERSESGLINPLLLKMTACITPLALMISLQAQAGEFALGEITGRANGSISVGGIWNAEKPDSNLIFQGNADHIGYGSAGEFNPSGARNGDDGRLNFRKRNLVSSPITLLAETELNWRNYGVFLRGKAWYDYTLNNREVDHGHSANGYQVGAKLNDSGFDDLAKFQGVALLDAYVFGDFEVGERPLHLRGGNQVINWGEGLFFQNGLNSINPVDLAALRRPGSQLKEALLPVPLLFANFGITDSLNLEVFYQLQWRETVLEGCGTYFASNDLIQDGCFGLARGGIAANPNDEAGYAKGLYVHRLEDDEPSDSGQFGMAMRYFADSISTEFGAYAMNIHSRTPQNRARTDLRPAVGAGWIAGQEATNAKYFMAFPEDVRIFGLSFSTSLLGASVFGEYSYRPNQPVGLSLGDTIPSTFGNPNLLIPGAPLAGEMKAAAPGSLINGYDRLEVSQLSLGFIKSFPRVLGADGLDVTGEVAMKYMHDLPALSERRYGKTEAYGSNMADGQGIGSPGCNAGVPEQSYKKIGCSRDGFVTDLSWGYRLRAQLNYSGLLAGVNVSPFMTFGQDVKGWSHDGNFVEDRLLGSLGVRASYKQNYSAELSWSGTGNTPLVVTDCCR